MDADIAKVQFSFKHEPTLEEIRSFYLAYLLELHGGNRHEVSKVLGISERNTYRLIKKLGMDKQSADYPTTLS